MFNSHDRKLWGASSLAPGSFNYANVIGIEVHVFTTHVHLLIKYMCIGLGTVSANLGALRVSRVRRRLLPASSAVGGGGGFCSMCSVDSVSSIGLGCKSSRVMSSS